MSRIFGRTTLTTSTENMASLCVHHYMSPFANNVTDEFIFPMTIHPDVSGRPHVLLMHERIIEHINKHEGVRWVTMGEVCYITCSHDALRILMIEPR